MAKDDVPKDIRALSNILRELEPLTDDERSFVLRTVADRLQVKYQASTSAGGPATPPPGFDQKPPSDAKEFLRQKKPKTEIQQIVCMAFFQTHVVGKPTFKTRELTDLNTIAGGTEISNPTRAVRDASEKYDLLSRKGADKIRITTFGEDLVNSLPDQESAKQVLLKAKRKGPNKRKRGQK